MVVELVAVAFGQRFLEDRLDHLWLRGGAGFADHAGTDLFFRIFEDLHEMVIIFAAQMLSGEDNAWITDGSAFFKRRTQQTDAGDGAEIGPTDPDHDKDAAAIAHRICCCDDALEGGDGHLKWIFHPAAHEVRMMVEAFVDLGDAFSQRRIGEVGVSV